MILLRVGNDFGAILLRRTDSLNVWVQTATAVADHVEELAIASVSMLDRRVVVQEEVLVPRTVGISRRRMQLDADAPFDQYASRLCHRIHLLVRELIDLESGESDVQLLVVESVRRIRLRLYWRSLDELRDDHGARRAAIR